MTRPSLPHLLLRMRHTCRRLALHQRGHLLALLRRPAPTRRFVTLLTGADIEAGAAVGLNEAGLVVPLTRPGEAP